MTRRWFLSLLGLISIGCATRYSESMAAIPTQCQGSYPLEVVGKPQLIQRVVQYSVDVPRKMVTEIWVSMVNGFEYEYRIVNGRVVSCRARKL
jgi:hypothetical protein